jgi:hypothetical protein
MLEAADRSPKVIGLAMRPINDGLVPAPTPRILVGELDELRMTRQRLLTVANSQPTSEHLRTAIASAAAGGMMYVFSTFVCTILSSTGNTVSRTNALRQSIGYS